MVNLTEFLVSNVTKINLFNIKLSVMKIMITPEEGEIVLRSFYFAIFVTFVAMILALLNDKKEKVQRIVIKKGKDDLLFEEFLYNELELLFYKGCLFGFIMKFDDSCRLYLKKESPTSKMSDMLTYENCMIDICLYESNVEDTSVLELMNSLIVEYLKNNKDELDRWRNYERILTLDFLKPKLNAENFSKVKLLK